VRPAAEQVLMVDPSGVSDPFSGPGLRPGIWGVDDQHSTATLRLRTWLAYHRTARLGAPAGELYVDFATGTPSRGVLSVPPVGARSTRSRRTQRLVRRLLGTVDSSVATLRLYEAQRRGAGRWSGSALLTVGGVSDRVGVDIQRQPTVGDCSPERATVRIDVPFRRPDFTAAGPTRRIRSTLRLRLDLELALVSP
jgi:hypothetical protein